MLDYLRDLPDRRAWQAPPAEVRRRIAGDPLPMEGIGEEAVYAAFCQDVLPYPLGNLHPRFFGWVQGNGMPLANMADMLASAMNPHMAGFHQSPAWVEAKVLEWMAELMGFPPTASGVLESGGTMANILGLAVARNTRAGYDFRRDGHQVLRRPMTVYCSSETHGWVTKGLELLGMGHAFLRKVSVDLDYRMCVSELESQIESDRREGLAPLCVIGTAGTVNTGATDDLNALADICRRENLWFHVDGAFGAWARVSPRLAPIVSGIERADSIAFDLHKWLYLPFEIACLLVRDAEAHRETFSLAPSYIAGMERGPIAGGLAYSDRGVDLTRGFKALKAWMCLKAYGVDAFAAAIEKNVDQTQLLVSKIDAHPELEMVAPAPMNVACFRYVVPGLSDSELNELNLEVLLRVQESGEALPSSTVLGGRFAIRACNVNHRATDADVERLVTAVVSQGRAVSALAGGG